MTPPALELRGLTKRYDTGVVAVEDFDLTIPDGAFFGLLGPNGAGKTTLISAVCNLIRVTGGEILVFGEPAQSLTARRWIGLAEQDINLDRFLTVEETLLYHGGYFGMAKDDAFECTHPMGEAAGATISGRVGLNQVGSDGMPVTLSVTRNGVETTSDMTHVE